MSEWAIEVASVRQRYGRAFVLDDLTLRVPRGAVFALLGRNGAGKSTLIRCLLGMLRPQAGRLRVLGCDAWRAREQILDSVGFVPEEPSAPGWASARRLAAFGRSVYTRWDDAGYAARLARFGVPLDMPFESLSRGQRGATMLALALGHAPELLVLDDPTLGLDAVARRFVFEELIGELADRGVSVFMASHDLAGVEAVADRIGVLAGGQIKVEGDLAELKERAGCSLEELFLGTLASTPEVAA